MAGATDDRRSAPPRPGWHVIGRGQHRSLRTAIAAKLPPVRAWTMACRHHPTRPEPARVVPSEAGLTHATAQGHGPAPDIAAGRAHHLSPGLPPSAHPTMRVPSGPRCHQRECPRTSSGPRLVGWRGGSSGDVAGSVGAGSVHPPGCRDAVEAEQVGQDRGGQVAGEVKDSAVAGRSDVDAEDAQAFGQVGGCDRTAGCATGKQPARWLWCVDAVPALPVGDQLPSRAASGAGSSSSVSPSRIVPGIWSRWTSWSRRRATRETGWANSSTRQPPTSRFRGDRPRAGAHPRPHRGPQPRRSAPGRPGPPGRRPQRGVPRGHFAPDLRRPNYPLSPE